ncbi:hypothetical protein SAMN05216361_0122 [Marisediminitalea aggregata]|uniref:Sulfotransferase family protein n=1 Tax=Marisediminitalea aggregata TaxID=634436 RepID=A0A1M5SXQ1_9ALTE|nr:hypothetical protein [Marisediminitalea aggregata]SHH43307.1 hypothetical protein SAMN05216361_0122 [Marisediminitalea aggregata]
MPYSIKKSFYFVRISKTAGMYLMEALREAIPDIVDDKNNYFPPVSIDGERHGDHIWLSDLYESLEGSESVQYSKFKFDRNSLDELKKFAVIRNPYTRTLSLFSFFRRFNNEVYTPKMFENDVFNIESRFNSYHLFQSDFICKKGSEDLLVDHLIPVENNLLEQVGDYVGVHLESRKKVNVSSTRKVNDADFFRNDLVVEKIASFFDKDFRVLGYSKSDIPK